MRGCTGIVLSNHLGIECGRATGRGCRWCELPGRKAPPSADRRPPVEVCWRRTPSTCPSWSGNRGTWLFCLSNIRPSIQNGQSEHNRNSVQLTLSFALPGGDDDTVNVALLAQVHHPDGVVHKVVVEDGAAVQIGVRVAVHRQRGPSVLPVFPQMAFVVEPRVALVGQILH